MLTYIVQISLGQKESVLIIKSTFRGSKMKIEEGRKVRSDKKRDVKPVIKIELKDAIYRLSYITFTPVKDVAESMLMYAMNTVDVLNALSPNFRRVVRIKNTLYRGSIDNPRISKRDDGNTERITIRLTQSLYESIYVLAYTLDVSPSRVCAILLDASMRDFRYLNNYVTRHLSSKLTTQQMGELQEILQYTNEEAEKKMTLADLLGAIVDEVSAPVSRIKDAVNEFIIHNWRD